MVLHCTGLRSARLEVYASPNQRACLKSNRISDIWQIITLLAAFFWLPVFAFVVNHLPLTLRSRRLVTGKPVAAKSLGYFRIVPLDWDSIRKPE
jgi:hypothetical protein